VAGTPPVPGEAASPDDVVAGLRIANARLRELLAERGHAGYGAGWAAGRAAGADRGADRAGRGPDSAGEAELEELQQAAVGRRAGEADAEVAAEEGRPQPGRPEGQPGVIMQLTASLDHVVRHEPAACRGCGHGLAGAEQTGMERRQVTEIPEVKAAVTE
jgi:hypothetical protein